MDEQNTRKIKARKTDMSLESKKKKKRRKIRKLKGARRKEREPEGKKKNSQHSKRVACCKMTGAPLAP